MTDLLLPDSFTRVTMVERVVQVAGKPDLTDPITGRVVIPEMVELHLRREEGVPGGVRERAYVGVTGPRRLKSRAAGQRITSGGWQQARGDGYQPGAVRPDWLTDVLTELLPEGWDPALILDQAAPEKDTNGRLALAAGESTPGSSEPAGDPLIVSRYDVVIEPAPDEEPVLTIGAVAEDGRPVALLFDPEARRRIAGWLAPGRTEGGA